MQSQCAPLQNSEITSAATCMTESIKDRRVGFRQRYTDHNNFSLCTARNHFKLHAGTRTFDIFAPLLHTCSNMQYVVEMLL
jgi:hypothetical protein